VPACLYLFAIPLGFLDGNTTSSAHRLGDSMCQPHGGDQIGELKMARPSNLERMSYAELSKLEVEIARLKAEKQNEERAALREKMAAMAREHGFDMGELFGRGKFKYRDPKNPENTWTGRGRMPRWMVAATKGSKAKKEDFLIK